MPNTIAENLQRLQNARTAISTAITNKGGTVPTGAGFEDFPTAINTIAGNTATITSTPPVSFRSNGEPLVDWEIEGSNDVGRNILQLPEFDETIDNVRWVSNPDKGTITANGTPTSRASSTSFTITLPAGTYRFTCRSDEKRDVTFDSYLRTGSGTIARGNNLDNPDQYFTLTNETTMYVYFRIAKNYTANNLVFTPMIQIDDGNTSDIFEPYAIGVGERTKNVVNLDGVAQVAKGNITITADAMTGYVTVSTRNGEVTNTEAVIQIYLPANISGDYYLSGSPDGGSETRTFDIYPWDETQSRRPYKWDGTTTARSSIDSTPQEVQFVAGNIYIIGIRIRSGVAADGLVFKPMLRASDTSADFIPYGYEIPVTCGGTTTDIFIGDSPLTEGESITKAEANVDIPTLNGNNNLVVDTVAQPDSVTIQYYNYVAGIPYNTDGLCLYFASDIGRVRIVPQTDYESDVSSLNSAPYSLTEFDDTTIEVRFTMPENFTDKARLIELGNHDGMILALNLNQDNIEVYANGTWAESFSTTFTGGETYTLSVTIGSGDIKVYVDGVYVEADTYTAFTVAGPIIAFANGGAIGMDTRWFPTNSDISKVRVYDRVLTAAEIAANYQIDNPT